MADVWYYTSGGRQGGPVEGEVLRQMVAGGQVGVGEMVWREGMGDWVPIAQVGELLPAGGMVGTAVPVGYGVGSYAAWQGVEYAGFWRRFVAAIIDGLITGVGGGVLGGIVGGVTGASGYGPGTREWIGVQVVINVVGILIAWLYSALLESSAAQATVGKMALGIRVTDEQGARISFGRATGRHFGKFISAIILMIGYVMAAFTERKQALHDVMAGTLVVKKGVGQ